LIRFQNTWPYEHELLQLKVLHPIEDIYNFSKVSNIDNKIPHGIDMSYDNNLESVPPLIDNDNIGSNRLHELQPEQLL
jgi:hypothetical protein